MNVYMYIYIYIYVYTHTHDLYNITIIVIALSDYSQMATGNQKAPRESSVAQNRYAQTIADCLLRRAYKPSRSNKSHPLAQTTDEGHL